MWFKSAIAVRSVYPTKCSTSGILGELFQYFVPRACVSFDGRHTSNFTRSPAHRKRRHREQTPAVKDSVMLFTSHPGAGLQHATTLLMGVRDRKKTICALHSVSKGGRQSAPMSDYFLHDPVCRVQPPVKHCAHCSSAGKSKQCAHGSVGDAVQGGGKGDDL